MTLFSVVQLAHTGSKARIVLSCLRANWSMLSLLSNIGLAGNLFHSHDYFRAIGAPGQYERHVSQLLRADNGWEGRSSRDLKIWMFAEAPIFCTILQLRALEKNCAPLFGTQTSL